MSDILERIDSALAGISPTPYHVDNGNVVDVNGSMIAESPSGLWEQIDADMGFFAAAPDLLRDAKAEIERLREWLKLIEEKGHIIEEGYPSFWSTQALGGRSVADVEP